MRKPLQITALLCLRSERFLPRLCLGFYMPFFHGKGMQFCQKRRSFYGRTSKLKELKYAHLANICQDLRRLAAHLRAEPITFFLLFLMIFCQDMQVLAADFVSVHYLHSKEFQCHHVVIHLKSRQVHFSVYYIMIHENIDHTCR